MWLKINAKLVAILLYSARKVFLAYGPPQELKIFNYQGLFICSWVIGSQYTLVYMVLCEVWLYFVWSLKIKSHIYVKKSLGWGSSAFFKKTKLIFKDSLWKVHLYLFVGLETPWCSIDKQWEGGRDFFPLRLFPLQLGLG